MPATVKQSYICEECGGRGRIGQADITDRYAVGEQQWRGYYPTNLCYACNGAGVWGVPQKTEPEKVKPKPPKPSLTLEQQLDGGWFADREDPRDRL